MAPAAPSSTAEASSTPLADYFFISGIESAQVYDERTHQNSSIVTSPLAQPPVDETIEEDRALETDSIRPTSQDGLPNGDGMRRRSANRLSENRQSIGTIIGSDAKQTASNRSSATIKGVQLGGSGLSPVELPAADDELAEVTQDPAVYRILLGGGAGLTGEAAQGHIPGGVWQRTVPSDGEVLVSCVVSPGFSFDDFTLAD